MKLFNFQHPKQKIYLGTYCGRTVFHLLRKLVGNQYPDVLRILVPPEILVLWKFLLNLRGSTYVQLNIFPDPILKKDFDIDEPVIICNFPKKLPINKYICV